MMKKYKTLKLINDFINKQIINKINKNTFITIKKEPDEIKIILNLINIIPYPPLTKHNLKNMPKNNIYIYESYQREDLKNFPYQKQITLNEFFKIKEKFEDKLIEDNKLLILTTATYEHNNDEIGGGSFFIELKNNKYSLYYPYNDIINDSYRELIKNIQNIHKFEIYTTLHIYLKDDKKLLLLNNNTILLHISIELCKSYQIINLF